MTREMEHAPDAFIVDVRGSSDIWADVEARFAALGPLPKRSEYGMTVQFDGGSLFARLIAPLLPQATAAALIRDLRAIPGADVRFVGVDLGDAP